MTLYAPLLLEAVTGDTAITYHAQDFRLLVSALNPNNGTVLAGDLKVSQRAAGANLSVDVAAGRALIPGTSIANQGTYVVRSDAVTNVAIATPPTTNPRIDIIVATVKDKQADGGTAYSWTLTAVAGTPAASPTVPATPASSIKLAEVAVAANAASIVTANITDRRILAGSGDVPKWDFNGTAGQTVANATEVYYAPGGTSQLVGATTTGNTSEVSILTPGRYVVHFCCRLASSTAAGDRTLTIQLTDSTGATVLRRIANTGTTAGNSPICASGTVYIDAAGKRVSAKIYQSTGQALAVDNTFLDANFTGVWIGS